MKKGIGDQPPRQSPTHQGTNQEKAHKKENVQEATNKNKTTTTRGEQGTSHLASPPPTMGNPASKKALLRCLAVPFILEVPGPFLGPPNCCENH